MPDAERRVNLHYSDPIVVLGAGAIGCGVAAALANTGREIVVTSRWEDHRDAMNSLGLRLDTEAGRSCQVTVKALDPSELGSLRAPIKVAYLTAKSQGTEPYARLVRECLAPDGVVVSLQNGINVDALTSVLGTRKVIGGVALFAARRTGPGEVMLTGKSSDVIIGELDGEITDRLELIGGLTDNPPWTTRLTANITGTLWSKLVGNATVNPLSVVGGWTVGQLVSSKSILRVLATMAAEACAVAEASGAKLEELATMDIPSIAAAARHNDTEAIEALLRERPGGVFADTKPSSLQDFELGVPTELEWLGGYVEAKGSEIGVPTPTTSRVMSVARRLEGGEQRSQALIEEALAG